MLTGDLSLCQVKGHHSQLQAPCRADEESPAPIVVAVVLFYLGRVLQAWLPFWDSQWKSTFSQASCSAPVDLPRLSLSLSSTPHLIYLSLHSPSPFSVNDIRMYFEKAMIPLVANGSRSPRYVMKTLTKVFRGFFSFQICRKIIRNPDKEGSGGLFGYRSVS